MSNVQIQKRKFIRNVLIGIVSLATVAFILNTAPGYKRDGLKDKINLVINEENITEELKEDVYINDNGTVYLSQEDVYNLFDKTVYYDNKYNQIVTSSDTKVATISSGQNIMIVNNVSMPIQDAIINKNGTIYIPVSEMSLIYNIKIEYIEENNIVVIEDLNTGMIVANVIEDTPLKFKPKALSKKVTSLVQGEKVSCFYTTSKGWRQVRTSSGQVGYIKANKLTNEYIIRQDTDTRQQSQRISINGNGIAIINKGGHQVNIMVQKLFKVVSGDNIDTNNTEDAPIGYEIWTTISNTGLETQTNQILSDYQTRAKIINTIVDMLIDKSLEGVVIDFRGITNIDSFNRFIIELTPRLREVGISIGVHLNSNMGETNIKDIVDYMIE